MQRTSTAGTDRLWNRARQCALAAIVSLLCGCPVSKSPKQDLADETPKPDVVVPPAPPVPSVTSFSELAAPPERGARIRWRAVLALAKLADIAYADASGQRNGAESLGAKDVRPQSIGSSEGFVASDDDVVVIAFRGTQGFADIVTDIKGFARDEFGGQVHHGFSKAIGTIYKDAANAAEAQGARKKTVWITGHSLGGALATAFTLRATKEKGIPVHGIVTFGQPLVMSENLCVYLHGEFGDRYLRIVNGTDPITRLVPKYRHAGARAQLNEDGTYDWRPPGVAPTAAPEDVTAKKRRRASRAPEGVVVDVEPDEDLQLMTDDEMREFERQVQQAHSPTAAKASSSAPMAAPGGWDPLGYHYMAGYIERIQTICDRQKDRPDAVGDIDERKFDSAPSTQP